MLDFPAPEAVAVPFLALWPLVEEVLFVAALERSAALVLLLFLPDEVELLAALMDPLDAALVAVVVVSVEFALECLARASRRSRTEGTVRTSRSEGAGVARMVVKRARSAKR